MLDFSLLWQNVSYKQLSTKIYFAHSFRISAHHCGVGVADRTSHSMVVMIAMEVMEAEWEDIYAKHISTSPVYSIWVFMLRDDTITFWK